MKLKKGECIPLTYDFMFTEVFNNPDNISILEYLIARYFSFDIEDVRDNLRLLSRDIPRENKNDAKMEVDLLLNYKGTKINIEMSNYNSNGVDDRNVVYACSFHGKQSNDDWSDYTNIKETIQIQFIHLGNKYKYHNENLLSNKVKLRRTIYLRDDDGAILTKKFRIDKINVDKGIKMDYNENVEENYLIAMCKLFNASTTDELEKAAKQLMDKLSATRLVNNVERLGGDEEMVNKFSELSKYEKEYRTAVKEEKIAAKTEGFNEGFGEGFDEGFEDGVFKKSLETAKNMLQDEMNIETISKYTGLSIDEINNLKD